MLKQLGILGLSFCTAVGALTSGWWIGFRVQRSAVPVAAAGLQAKPVVSPLPRSATQAVTPVAASAVPL